MRYQTGWTGIGLDTFVKTYRLKSPSKNIWFQQKKNFLLYGKINVRLDVVVTDFFPRHLFGEKIGQRRDVLDWKNKNQTNWEWNGMLTCALHWWIGSGLDLFQWDRAIPLDRCLRATNTLDLVLMLAIGDSVLAWDTFRCRVRTCLLYEKNWEANTHKKMTREHTTCGLQACRSTHVQLQRILIISSNL